MTSPAPRGFLAALLTRWITDDPSAQVIETGSAWQPTWPAGVLLAILVVMWLLVAVIHRSRRLDLSTRWRVGLGLLRAVILALPVLMLAQPHIAAQLERSEPKTLAVLLDRSPSMSLEDGPETVPTSRWQRAAEAIAPALSAVAGVSVGGPPAVEPLASARGPRVATYLFDEALSPVDLAEVPGSTGPPGRGRTAIGNALQGVHSELAGGPTAGVLLVTDGADNASGADRHPLRVARRLARAGIPVHACLVGNERPRELTVSVVAEAPFAYAGDPVGLRVRIEQQGFDDNLVTVTLLDGDRVVETKDAALPATGAPVVERFEVQPGEPGRKRYRVETTPLPGELTTTNNHATADVHVIDQPIRVLYIERWPRWQYRFLRNAMRRDRRFEPTLVLLTEDPATPAAERQAASFPASAEELSQFDVIVVGDLAPQDLSPQQWEWLRDHVIEDGAGAVFIAGPAHMPGAFVETALGPLLPFERVTAIPEEDVISFSPVVTPLGACHPLVRLSFGEDPGSVWRRLPPLGWYAGVADLKPGAMVLVHRPADAGGDPTALVILHRVGRASVLFVGTDETWKWRYEVGNRYFYGFWAHAIQHVGMPHRVGEFQSVRIETPATIAPDVPTAVSVAIESGTASIDGEADETLTLIAEQSEGRSPPVSFKLRRAADSPFLYEGELQLADKGRYRLLVEGYEDRGEAALEVSGEPGRDPELSHAAINPALLRQIADVTGGEFVTLGQLPALIGRLDFSPLRYRWSERIPLWDGWTMLIALAVLLTAEWVLRKWRYLP